MSVSSVSSNTGFNFDGVVSGLRTGDIITKLMSIQQGPLLQLQKQQLTVQSRDKAYQDIATKVTSLQSAVSTLLLQGNTVGKTATSSSTSIATATANANAANGTFSINVLSLATATSTKSNATLGTAADMTSTTTLNAAGLSTVPTSGTFTINGQTITVDASATGDTWATLQNKISTATGGAVTLNLGTNGVSLTSNTPMQIGGSSDTSNLLSALHLTGAAQTGTGPYTIASNQLLGEAQSGNPLSTAGLNVAGGIAASGTFSINGTAISWTNSDSLNTVISRINASSAGVSASYDSTTDTIALTNTTTGAQSISLSDTSGNFLQAMHLIGATQTYGAPASYTITQNGSTTATQYSNTNAVTNALPNVNLNLLATGTTGITVAQDTSTATNNTQSFITAFNNLVDVVNSYTAYDTKTNTASLLTGDSTITGLADQLRSIAQSAALVPTGAAYSTLSSIGITTGAYGSAIGSTEHLQLDTTKLSSALQNNPNAVYQMLSGLTGTTTLASDPTNPWIQSTSGSPWQQLQSGTYAVTYTPGGSVSSVFTPTSGVAQPAVTGTVVAGGTQGLVIPGMVLTARNPLPAAAGTDTLTYTVTNRGVMQSLNSYLTQALGPNGLFRTEQNNAQTELSSLTSQIQNQNDLLAQRQATLQAQFTAMETALARLNSQSSSVLSAMGIASSSSAPSSSPA